jgi:hypothetical protein
MHSVAESLAGILVVIVILVMVVIAMVVAPGPIFLLLILVQSLEVAITVAMGLVGPLTVVDNLIVVPYVIVGVVGVVDTDGMVLRASDAHE